MGHSRRFGRLPVASGLPRTSDIIKSTRHVSKVPILLQKSVVTDGCWLVVSLTAIGFVRRLLGALYATLTLRNTRRMSGWRSRNQRREPPQVLGDGSKDKLVLGTSRSTQSKPTELQDAL
jgi:hypothetical protein